MFDMLRSSYGPRVVTRGVRSKYKNAFEVSINSVLVFSKREQRTFPNFDDLVLLVGDVCNGHPPTPLTTTEDCFSCRYTSCCQLG